MSTPTLVQLLEKLRADVPHFFSADIVEIESGMSLAGLATDPNFDGSAASASYAEVIKANARALDILGLGAATTEDILITTKDIYLLLRMIGTRYYLGLAISRQGTLGFARTVMQKTAAQVQEAIPH